MVPSELPAHLESVPQRQQLMAAKPPLRSADRVLRDDQSGTHEREQSIRASTDGSITPCRASRRGLVEEDYWMQSGRLVPK
jgi:ABC-type tungstate transport system permease subunit